MEYLALKAKSHIEMNSLSNGEQVNRVSDIRCIIRPGSINYGRF